MLIMICTINRCISSTAGRIQDAQSAAEGAQGRVGLDDITEKWGSAGGGETLYGRAQQVHRLVLIPVHQVHGILPVLPDLGGGGDGGLGVDPGGVVEPGGGRV